ncbi:sensor histidine kinase [Solidesulfovibrio magneticus]|uniref:histidine kinase n=1 Tax=Solidesulfovibrio magneticus (strain ATCC 700980 / DSM 13731 / RS-1) TaxID=573370 RepID=C4XMK1_SOLM1|nr:PAS domain-containing sensor histidine kinase [Solidesulfovibrio magneticus]BAH74792.1 two-component sensor histidine kinase [Solidesulfovibrio magneticus RS-1]
MTARSSISSTTSDRHLSDRPHQPAGPAQASASLGPVPAPDPSFFAAQAALLYERLPHGLALSDPDGRLVCANRALRRLLGAGESLPEPTLAGLIARLCPAVTPARAAAMAAATQRWHTPNHPMIGPSGQALHVRLLFESVPFPDGRTGLTLTVEDTTSHRAAIDAWRRRQTQYRSLVEGGADAMCRFLPDLSLLYANAPFCRLFGLSRRGAVGKSLLSLVSLEAGRAVVDAVSALSPRQPAGEVDLLLGYADDRPRWLRLTVRGFFYRTGHLKDCQAVGADVSDHKLAEDRFIHASRLVSLGALVSGVAHEVSNPNQAIALNARLCQDLWEPVAEAASRLAQAAAMSGGPGARGPTLADALADMPALLADMADCSGRIADIVSELKEFGSHDDGSGFAPVAVNDAVRAAARLMRPTLKRSTRRFSLRLCREGPVVLGRRQRLEQVLVNLLENACLALPNQDAPIVIETALAPEGDAVRVLVRDAGTGIAPGDLRRVTEPFFTTRRGQGGTGLGLSISHKIAREHGGSLELVPNAGPGVTAVVALPLAGLRQEGLP